jgi:hypothetical protein
VGIGAMRDKDGFLSFGGDGDVDSGDTLEFGN